MIHIRQLFITTLLIAAGLTAYGQQETYHKSFVEKFNGSELRNFRANIGRPGAEFTWESGVPAAIEKKTKVLSFRIGPGDPPGAGRGPEIVSSKYTHFGTYAARIKVPRVKETQPNAGVVVGYFTYYTDTIDGLSEIDYEWLVADPEIIYIGTWTGYRGDLRRIGRTINLAKGIIYNTSYRERKSGIRRPLTGVQSQPETIPAIEGYDASSQFYTYGFDWYSNRIRWWMLHPSTADTIVLWDYTGSTEGIPQNHTRYRFNFWHTADWPVETNPNSIERPLHPYETEVDWMSYNPLNPPKRRKVRPDK